MCLLQRRNIIVRRNAAISEQSFFYYRNTCMLLLLLENISVVLQMPTYVRSVYILAGDFTRHIPDIINITRVIKNIIRLHHNSRPAFRRRTATWTTRRNYEHGKIVCKLLL